jgi:hypothetical protein
MRRTVIGRNVMQLAQHLAKRRIQSGLDVVLSNHVRHPSHGPLTKPYFATPITQGTVGAESLVSAHRQMNYYAQPMLELRPPKITRGPSTAAYDLKLR